MGPVTHDGAATVLLAVNFCVQPTYRRAEQRGGDSWQYVPWPDIRRQADRYHFTARVPPTAFSTRAA